MHNRLPVYGDPYLVVRHPEEVVGFYCFEALVHHGGGVYRDLGTHLPCRVLQSILRPHLRQFILGIAEERSPRSGQQDLTHLLRTPPLQALEDGRVLRIYGYYAVVSAVDGFG